LLNQDYNQLDFLYCRYIPVLKYKCSCHTKKNRVFSQFNDQYLLKTFIPVSRVFFMKTTFSYFPGNIENPAPAKYYFKKQNQKY